MLPNALYKVLLDNGQRVTAGISTSLKHQVVRLITGDRVNVKLTTFDPNRGQITGKL